MLIFKLHYDHFYYTSQIHACRKFEKYKTIKVKLPLISASIHRQQLLYFRRAWSSWCVFTSLPNALPHAPFDFFIFPSLNCSKTFPHVLVCTTQTLLSVVPSVNIRVSSHFFMTKNNAVFIILMHEARFKIGLFSSDRFPEIELPCQRLLAF